MKRPSASLAKGRSGSVKAMSVLLRGGSTGKPMNGRLVQPRIGGRSLLMLNDPEALEIGPRRRPIGGELARHPILLIGFANIAQLFIGDRPPIMCDGRP